MRSSLAFMRSAWKGPYIVPLPIREAQIKKAPIKTRARSCTILPSFVGLRFLVHNGRDYIPVRVTENMVGTKLGEYASTRKPFRYKKT